MAVHHLTTALFLSKLVRPLLGFVLAVLPLVFVCDIVARTLFWRLGLKESWI